MTTPFVFLDFDGTLVNSETLLRDVEMGIIRGHGVDLTEADWHEQYRDLSIPEFALVLESLTGVAHDWTSQLEAEYEAAWSKSLSMHPGVLNVVGKLKNRRLIVTSSSQKQLAAKLAWADIPDSWGVGAVTRDDVVSTKPDPEPYLVALARAEVSPDKAIAIEDSRTGVAAAQAAGISVIGFSGGLDTAQQLADSGAIVMPNWSAIGKFLGLKSTE